MSGEHIPDPAGWNRIKYLEDQLASGVHYEFTCDAGYCERETVAIVLVEHGWISMCRLHAAQALGATWRAHSVAHTLLNDADDA